MAFWFNDTRENRKKLIENQKRALENYKAEKSLKARIKKKKPNYGYRKWYA